MLDKQAKCVMALLASGDDSLRQQAMKQKDQILELVVKGEQNHLQRLRSKLCSAESGVVYIELLSEIRKVSRHLANIAERSEAFYTQVQDERI